jgi:glycosyltransferase involved in cell wall biosynthesis
VSLSPVVVLPAPPHPAARNTAARYYAALLRGFSQLGMETRAFALDDGSGAAAVEWAADLPGVSLETFSTDPVRRDPVARAHRLARPMWDAAPARLRERLARELADGYDVLHVEEVHLAALTANRPRSILSILHSEARDGRVQSENVVPLSRLRRAPTLRAERLLLRRQRHLRAISRALEADIRAAGAKAPISVIPLSLDLDRYTFQPDGRPPVAGLIGSMMWPPTRRATLRLVREIWPRVIAALPSAELVVAGWAAHTLRAAGEMPPRVTLLSDLPDHQAFFDRVGLLVFPIDVGSGMKVKVLESMAYGVPVLTTQIGVEGLEAAGELAWWEATDSASFAHATIAALGDEAERQKRAREARALLERQCAPEVVASQLADVYRQIAAP